MDLDELIDEIQVRLAEHNGLQEKIALAQVLAIREQTKVLRVIDESLDSLQFIGR